jgi:membrane-bound lytic murein transglycosylase B
MRNLALLAAPLILSACAAATPGPEPSAQVTEAPDARRGTRLPDALCPGPAPEPVPAAMPNPPGAPPPPSTPPPPVPPPPPEGSAWLATPEPVLTGTGDPRLDAWMKRVLREGGSGWRPYLLRAFAPVRSNPAVLEEKRAFRRPATPADYYRQLVTPARIAQGRRLYAELQGRPLPGKAPLEVRLALWGALSGYGAERPRFDLVEALANLGACGEGPGWSGFAIFKATALLAEGRLDRGRALAWGDGRIGQTRSLLDLYTRFAADGDGDGLADIWTNRADILATLSIPAWEDTQPMIVEVEPPRFDPNDRGQARMDRGMRTRSGIGATYLKRPGDAPWPAEAARWAGQYVEAYGPSGPAFLLTRNFTPVNYQNPSNALYNRLEDDPGFGLAVALLAEAIAGRPAPSRPIG